MDSDRRGQPLTDKAGRSLRWIHGGGTKHRLGVGVHRLSDRLHLLSHWLINDPDWRMRNG